MALSMDEKLYDFRGEQVHETDKAVLINIEDETVDGDPIWFPKSVIQNNRDGTFTIPMDWAEDKGMA